MRNMFSVSDSARNRLYEIFKKKDTEVKLRLSISAGGCSGFQYIYELEDTNI